MTDSDFIASILAVLQRSVIRQKATEELLLELTQAVIEGTNPERVRRLVELASHVERARRAAGENPEADVPQLDWESIG